MKKASISLINAALLSSFCFGVKEIPSLQSLIQTKLYQLESLSQKNITTFNQAIKDGIIRSENIVFNDREFIGDDFPDGTLSKICLKGATFNNCKFKNVILNEANLSNATFNHTTFEDVSLVDADLRGTISHKVSMKNVILRGALIGDEFRLPSDYDISPLAAIQMYSYILNRADKYKGQGLIEAAEKLYQKAKILNKTLIAWQKLNLKKSVGPNRLNLNKLNLRGIDLSYANLLCISLVNTDLTDANLQNTYLVYANLTNAILSNTNLKKANLTNALLSGADLHTANLENAIFNQPILRILIRSKSH